MGKSIKLREYNFDERAGGINFSKKLDLVKQLSSKKEEKNFTQLFLQENKPGISFGCTLEKDKLQWVGMPEGYDGNVLVVGGIGSGKSCGIAIPTLRSWSGAIFATDLKGELSRQYEALYQSGTTVRPYIIFNPMEAEGPSYDPFWWLEKDDEANLISNIWEIVLAIIPSIPEDNQPFWVESEQALFAASLLYFFKLGLSFSEAVCELLSSTITTLCQKLTAAEYVQVRILLGNIECLKSDVLAAIDRGLRNKLMLFASDPHISHVFRGTREGAKCFTWDELEGSNIFIQIPASKVEWWGGAINLMLTQLFHYLERRPEKYTSEAEHIPQTLLLLDEFARFGKLDMLLPAMATLRSKKVNICLFAQSLSQIDAIYGTSERRIVLDNCQYLAILRANDPETQEALCKLIGTRIQQHHSIVQQLNASMKHTIGYSAQINEVRDWMICPHELASLDDVLLLTPYGFLRVQKCLTSSCIKPGQLVSSLSHRTFNKGATMLMIDDRAKKADERVKGVEHQQRVVQKQAKDKMRQQKNHLKYTIGGLVLKYFPELNKIGSEEARVETQPELQDIESLLAFLSERRDWLQRLRTEANNTSQSIPQRADM